MNYTCSAIHEGSTVTYTLSGAACDVDSAVNDLRRKYPAIAYGTRVMKREESDGVVVAQVRTYSAD